MGFTQSLNRYSEYLFLHCSRAAAIANRFYRHNRSDRLCFKAFHLLILYARSAVAPSIFLPSKQLPIITSRSANASQGGTHPFITIVTSHECKEKVFFFDCRRFDTCFFSSLRAFAFDCAGFIGRCFLTMTSDELEGTSLLLARERTSDASAFARLLNWDQRASARLYNWYRRSPYTPHWALMALETSGHGLLWVMWPPLLFALSPQMPASLLSGLVNFYVLVLLDLLVILIMKPLFRRARPAYNSGLQPATVEAVDQFSFPSGHATRGVSVAAFVVYVATVRSGSIPAWMESLPFMSFVVLWGIAVAASRVALGRHHVLDVLAGAFIGIAYVAVIDNFWISDADVSAGRDIVLKAVHYMPVGPPERYSLRGK